MTTERRIERDGAWLRLVDTGGTGAPVVFQHGLGGSEAQVRQNFPDEAGFRRLTLECRAQGGSEAGATRPFTLAMFADDVLAAANEAGLDRFVAGGISTGAAIALRLAHRHPERVSALVLVRPSWAFEPAPPNMRPFAEIGALLRRHLPEDAKRLFEASPTAATLSDRGPDNLKSLLTFFDRPDPLVTADLLEGIASDGHGVSRETAARLDAFLALLLRWNARINLVAVNDPAELRARHVADSLQLLPLLPEDERPAADLGTGGGFPGLVLAIADTGRPWHLVESDRRKAAFLQAAAAELGLAHVAVHPKRIEEVALAPLGLLTARALAPLTALLPMAARLLAEDGTALFPKGRGAEAELTAAAVDWTMDVARYASRTAPDATLFRLTRIRRAGL